MCGNDQIKSNHGRKLYLLIIENFFFKDFYKGYFNVVDTWHTSSIRHFHPLFIPLPEAWLRIGFGASLNIIHRSLINCMSLFLKVLQVWMLCPTTPIWYSQVRSLRGVAWWQGDWDLYNMFRVRVRICTSCKSLGHPGF